MKNKAGNIIWGILFIAAGIGYAGKAFDFWDFNIFFDGFWTLFLIIPAIIEMVKHGFKVWNVTLFVIGILFFLRYQDFFDFDITRKLIWPLILVAIGFGIMFSKDSYKKIEDFHFGKNISAVFSSKNVILYNEPLLDMRVEAVFSGITLDFRNAIIDSDVHMHIEAVFSGVRMYLPDNIEIKVANTPVFGGITNRKMPVINGSSKKIYINSETVFGGIEII